MLRGSYKIGLPSKGRQEFGAGRLVLWGLLKPGVVLGALASWRWRMTVLRSSAAVLMLCVMAVEDDCASVLYCSVDVV